MDTMTNALFRTDCLVLLERLPSCAVDLVYLDPTFPDRSRDSTETFLESLGRVLQQAHRCLTESGSVFVHVPAEHATDNVRFIAQQALGDASVRMEITWPRSKSRVASRGPHNGSDTILWYSKSDSFVYNPQFRPFTADELNHFSPLLDEQKRRYRLVDMTTTVNRPSFTFIWKGCKPALGRSWRYSRDRMDELARQGMIVIPSSGSLPRLKQYLDEMQGVEIDNHWQDIPYLLASNEKLGYPGQKPLRLLERVVRMASNIGQLVVDPFCGTGTALVAAHSNQRRFIGCDVTERAFDLSVSRLSPAMGDAWSQGVKTADGTLLTTLPIAWSDYQSILASPGQVRDLQQQLGSIRGRLGGIKQLIAANTETDEISVERVISEIETKIIEQIIKAAAMDVGSFEPRLREMVGAWDRLEEDSRLFLLTAHWYLANTPEELDFSPAALSAWKCVEKELLAKLFQPFKDSTTVSDEPKASRTVQNLLGFMAGRMHLVLGNMSALFDCIGRGKEMQSPAIAAFVAFIRQHCAQPEFFLQGEARSRVILSQENIQAYRNGAAHIGAFTRARATASVEFVTQHLDAIENALR